MKDEFFTLLITQIWQVSVLVLIVGAVVGLFAKDRPHLAHALWVLVLIKCITPPIWSSPVSPFSWLTSPGAPPIEQFASADTDRQSDDSASIPFARPPIVVYAQPETWPKKGHPNEHVDQAPTAPAIAMDPGLSTNTESPFAFCWSTVLLSIWVVGAEVRFLSTPRDVLQKLGVQWSVAQSSNDRVVSEVGLVESSDGGTAFAPDLNGNILIRDTSVLRALATELESGSQVSAASYIEKSSPVIYALVSDDEIQKIISVVQQNRSSTILQVPTVTMFDGQTAEIRDGSEVEFVVGLNRVIDQQGKLPESLQPVIRVVSNGSTVFLKAKSNADDSVSLDCHVRFSKILSVDRAEMPIAGQAETRSFQFPEVSTVQLRSTMDVPEGKTLILGSFKEGDQG